ncbi:MAG: hypothetical protein ACREX6_09285, partial [Casimicrobiaceae bacterium]
ASAALIYVSAGDAPAVSGLVLVNPWVRSDETFARTRIRHYYVRRIFAVGFWRKLLTGRVRVGAALDEVREVLRAAQGAREDKAQMDGANASAAPADQANVAAVSERTPFRQRMLDGFHGFAGPVLLLMSERDLTAREFDTYARSDPHWKKLLGRPAVTRCDIADADHTFSATEARRGVERATIDWLRACVERARVHRRVRIARTRRSTTAMKRVLMIAYHFPPLAGSSGIQRTLRFVRHLPEFGWEPVILTTMIGAYERTSPDLDADVPAGLIVERAFAFDAARHLALAGRYPGPLARPDRWMTWRWDAVRRGMDLVRRLRPEAIWSTYPIATAHVIGAALERRTGLPWIADFRDPMAQD